MAIRGRRGGRGRWLQRDGSPAKRAVAATADDATTRTVSSGSGGGAIVAAVPAQWRVSVARRATAIADQRDAKKLPSGDDSDGDCSDSGGGGSGARNGVEQRCGGALLDRSIPDETQQQWKMSVTLTKLDDAMGCLRRRREALAMVRVRCVLFGAPLISLIRNVLGTAGDVASYDPSLLGVATTL
ncbi:hypothetical protein Syun_003971 [Stephania yunnanensis]|uniref:Uncharacterized protein n=1 Tax=Stephania yunnanensis TaxID=152371 RepID=A0AAP0L5B6_9MAGN